MQGGSGCLYKHVHTAAKQVACLRLVALDATKVLDRLPFLLRVNGGTRELQFVVLQEKQDTPLDYFSTEHSVWEVKPHQIFPTW